MKKVVVGALILVLLVSFAVVSSGLPDALGEGITFHRILPVEQDWVDFDSAPELAVCSEKYTVVFSEGRMVAISSSGEERFSKSTENRKVVSAFTYDDLLFVRYNGQTKLVIYRLPDFAESNTEIVSPYVTGNGNRLFLAFRNAEDHFSFSEYVLDEESETALRFNSPITEDNFFVPSSVYETEAENVSSFAVSEDCIYYVSSDNAIRALPLSGELSSFVMNDTFYRSVATAGGLILGLPWEGEPRVRMEDGETVNLPINDEPEKTLASPISVSGNLEHFLVSDAETKSVNVFRVKNPFMGLSYERSIAGRGSGTNRLDSPSDVFADDKIYLADTGNDRVVVREDETNMIISGFNAPYGIVRWRDYICVCDEDGIKLCDLIDTPIKIADLTDVSSLTATKDGIFVLKNEDEVSRVYKISEGESSSGYVSEIFIEHENEPILKLASYYDGTSLSVITTKGVEIYFSDGEKQFETPLSALNLAFDDVTNFLMGARSSTRGDVYMLVKNGSGNTLVQLTRGLKNFTRTASTPLPSDFSDFTIASDGTVYFSEQGSHSLFEMSGYTVSMSDPHFAPPIDVDADSSITDSAYVFEVERDCYMYTNPYNFESIVPVSEGERLVALHNDLYHCGVDKLYYVYRNGQLGFIPVDDVTCLPSGVAPSTQYHYVNKNYSDVLYKYPIEDARFALKIISRHSELLPVGTVSDFEDGSWYEVLYENSIYYIKRVHVDIANPPAPTRYFYAKIRTDTIGIGVPVYTLPDVGSTIKSTLGDGTEIKLVEELNTANTFTYVVCGDVEGYVLTKNISTGGLTSAQITGLVLIGAAGLSSILIFGLGRKLKKHKEEE